MPIEAKVIPTWQAAMYSSMWSICRRACATPDAPSFSSASRRSTRERTSAYSAATKNAFSAISAGTPRSSSASKSDAPPGAGYFEEGRRRPSTRTGRRLPTGPGHVNLVRAVPLRLKSRRHALARARQLRAPGVTRAAPAVVHAQGPAATHTGPHPHQADQAAGRARVLEGHERALPHHARGRREGGHRARAVRIDLAVAPARRGRVDVVLPVRHMA